MAKSKAKAKNRKKEQVQLPPVPNAVSKAMNEAVDAANTYRQCRLQIEQIEAEIQNKQAIIANNYASDLYMLKAQVTNCESILGEYAAMNRRELLGQSKSTNFAGVKMGFRKSTAKVQLTNSSMDWNDVLAIVSDDSNMRFKYVKTKKELDKTKLKAATEEELQALGLEVVQEENFFVKL